MNNIEGLKTASREKLSKLDSYVVGRALEMDRAEVSQFLKSQKMYFLMVLCDPPARVVTHRLRTTFLGRQLMASERKLFGNTLVNN